MVVEGGSNKNNLLVIFQVGLANLPDVPFVSHRSPQLVMPIFRPEENGNIKNVLGYYIAKSFHNSRPKTTIRAEVRNQLYHRRIDNFGRRDETFSLLPIHLSAVALISRRAAAFIAAKDGEAGWGH